MICPSCGQTVTWLWRCALCDAPRCAWCLFCRTGRGDVCRDCLEK